MSGPKFRGPLALQDRCAAPGCAQARQPETAHGISLEGLTALPVPQRGVTVSQVQSLDLATGPHGGSSEPRFYD